MVLQTSEILTLFRQLQPAEQKRILDILQDELSKTGFECTYCGRRIRDPAWLANLPLCRSCHSRIFSPVEKRRMVYGGR
jgi:DNA-directed RNA polymerase subunit RPC12/RpoP